MNTNGIHISEWVASLDVRKPFYLAIVNRQGDLTFTNSGFYTRFLSPPKRWTITVFLTLFTGEIRRCSKKCLRPVS